MKGNFGGFEHSAEADINELRQKLKGYGSQEAFLKEILQNTDDAGATLQRIAWIPGREEAEHPLLRGPALALINDKALKPSEVRAIKRMGLGTKGAAQHAIGKFGQGIKTIFQVCEAFFFLARDPDVDGEGPNERELCNPWFGWHHPEWNRFEAEDTEEILRRMSTLLPDGPWFLLYLPLRRRAHLHSNGQHVQPIVESHQGDLQVCPPSFRERLVEDVPSLLPLLKSVRSVELFECWDRVGKGPDVAVEMPDGSVRCSFDPDNQTDADLCGQVVIGSAVEESVDFVGATQWITAPKLQALAAHDLRPRIVGTGEAGATIETREKAYPHAGIAITSRAGRAINKRGRISFRWAVFLPVGGAPLDAIEWPTPLDLEFYLHGYFFLDATRTRVDGQDGQTPFAESEVRDEQSYCKQWNQMLAREGTLPLLPECLHRVSREILKGDLAQTTELTKAIEGTSVFRQFRSAILSRHHWALTVRNGVVQWEALGARRSVVPLPEPFSAEYATILNALPGLAARVELDGAIPVIHRLQGSPGGCFSWMECEPSDWTERAIREALAGVTAETYERNQQARNYVLLFLRARTRETRDSLFAGILSEVRLFPAEEIGGGGSRGLISASQLCGYLEAECLISTTSDRDLAMETADVLGRSWWRLTDSAVVDLLPECQSAVHLALQWTAQLILDGDPSGSEKARHALVKRFVREGNWFNHDALERRAARFLLHRTADRIGHDAGLYLQGPETPAAWLAIAEYVLQESAEEWRLLREWIDLTFEQRRSLGVEILEAGAVIKLLHELGPGMDFCDLPAERRQFLTENCNPDLVRKLSIHQLVTGKLTAATEHTYLDAEFRFQATDEEQLWRELSSRSRIVVRQADPIQFARQLAVFDSRVVDADGIIHMAIDQGAEANRFWKLILSCLARLGTPKAQTRERLTDPKLRWLPLNSGGFVAAPDIISLSGIPGADEVIHGLLGSKADGTVSVLALEDPLRLHAGFPPLQSQLLPKIPAALAILTLALQVRGDCSTGLPAVESVVELSQWVGALEGFDHPAYPLLPLLRAVAKDESVAERWLPHLNSDLAGALDAAATLGLLEKLATACEGDRLGRSPLVRLHRKALECAVAAGYWPSLAEQGVRLPNRAGAWKPAGKLVHAFEGVSGDYLVQEELGHFLAGDVQSVSGVEPMGSTRQESVAGYATALAKRAPREIVGLFVAVLGGTLANQELANEHLRGMDIREMIAKVIPAHLSVGGRNVLEVWERVQFFPQVLTGKSVLATSLAGTPLEIPIAKNPETLLFGEFILRATATLPGDGRHINHRLQLLDLDFFPESNSEDEWIGRVLRTLDLLLQHRYCLENCAGLRTLARQLVEMRGRWDIRVAQRLVLKSGDQLIQTLGVHQEPELRALLAKWQHAKQYEAQAEEFGDDGALLEKSKNMTREAEERLRSLLSDSTATQKVFRDAMRRKITGFQYFPDSVLFELFQNADDAYVEQSVVVGTPAGEASAAFRVELWESYLRVIHHGRPINQPNAEEHGRDLQKMLLLNASDKEVRLADGAERTGHFGLGFKSVHLVSDAPAVVSGDLAFVVSGGVYPQRLEQEELIAELQRYKPIGSVPATVIHLPLAEGLPQGAVLDRFVRLRPWLTIFARKVRSILIAGGNPVETRWNPRTSSFFDHAEIGNVAGVSGHMIALREPVAESGEVQVVLLVTSSGFQRLPAGVPTLWATAPLDVDGEMCIAINGPFDIDAGRRQLAAMSEKNPVIQAAGCDVLGSWLVALAQNCRANWDAVRVELGLSPELSPTDLWESFWMCLPRPQHAGESVAHTVAKKVLFRGQNSGCGRVLLGERVLPAQLGSSARLVAWPEISHVVTGILAECKDIFDALWPSELAGKAVSAKNVMRRLEDWFPNLEKGHLQWTSIRELLWAEAENAGHVRFSPASAATFGRTLTKDRIERLEEEEGELYLEEWLSLADKLAGARFKTAAHDYRAASEIMVAATGPEERLRCGFAPESALLSGEYDEAGIRFFLLCRGDLQLRTDRLVEWARDAIGVRLGHLLRFFLQGDARVRDGTVKGLGSAWIQRVERAAEFLTLPVEDQRSVLLWFRHRVEVQPAAFLPVADEIVHTTPERLLEWWEARAHESPAIQLTGNWGELLFGDLLADVDEASVAEALRNPGDEDPVVGDHVWFRTLCLCSLLATRTPREVAERFFERLREDGFFQRVQPNAVRENDVLFEQELRGAIEEIMQRPLEGEHGGGERAELWRRMFYDARKMYRLVYLNQFPSTLLEVIETATEPRAVFRFLRAGEILNQARMVGVVGQSFKSPLFLLIRELRRLRVIETDLFDPTCFYVCAPVRRAVARLGIRGDLTEASQDLDVDQHLQWSEALFQWVSDSTVAKEYLTRSFDLPFYAVDELNGYHSIRLPL